MTAMTAHTERVATRWQPLAEATARAPRPTIADLDHIPGRRGLPLLGVMPEALWDPLAFAERMVAAHGRVYRFHAFGQWHVHAVGAEANRRLLFDEDGTFSAREGWAQLIEPLFPRALLVMDGPEHRAERRLLGEAFRQTQLDGYRDIFAGDIETAIAGWIGRRIEPYPEIRRLTFRIAASTFLGTPLEREAAVAVAALGRMIRSLLAMGRSPLPSLVRARGRVARRRLHGILRLLIEEKRLAPGTDLLSRMTQLAGEDGGGLAPARICDSFAFLLSAAHDTLASSLTSLAYYLAVEPDWAARMRAELDAAGIDDPAAATAAELPLMDMFYKETLRLNGPAPVVWRRALADFVIDGCRIPAGTMTGANLMMTHRLAELWPDPARFDPFRFAPETEQARSRFAFIPFGAGVHKCLGMHFARQQARVFLTVLLRRTELRLAGTRPARWYHWPNCRPRRPFHLEVIPSRRGR